MCVPTHGLLAYAHLDCFVSKKTKYLQSFLFCEKNKFLLAKLVIVLDIIFNLTCNKQSSTLKDFLMV